MGIIITGETGEVTWGSSMMRIVGAVDGFIKESIWRSSFLTLEIGKVSPERTLE